VTSERVHLSSPDGERWIELPIGGLKEGELSAFPARVLAGDDTGLMVVASAYQPDTDWPAPSLWTSPDGVHWTRAVEDPSLAPRDQVNGFVVVGDRIVAVGQINNSAAVWIATRVRASVDPTATEAPSPVATVGDGDLISIPTAPPLVPDQNGAVACHDALLSGRLVLHPEWGIGVGGGQGESLLVFWPHGYVGRIAGDRIELLDGEGRVVGRTGDRIRAGGGMTTINGVEGFGVCPVGIEVQPGP
jgi:hypothetical protein